MEMIKRVNEDFNLAGFYQVEDGKLLNTYINFVPKGIGKDPSKLDQIKFNKVEADSVNEFISLVDQEEERLINLYERAAILLNKKLEGVGV